MSTRALHYLPCTQCGGETLHVSCRCVTCGTVTVKAFVRVMAASEKVNAVLTPKQRALRQARQKNPFKQTIRTEISRGRQR